MRHRKYLMRDAGCKIKSWKLIKLFSAALGIETATETSDLFQFWFCHKALDLIANMESSGNFR